MSDNMTYNKNDFKTVGTVEVVSQVDSNNHLRISSIEGFSQTISNFCVVVTLIYAVYQHNNSKRHRKIEKAAELSKEYAKEVVPKMYLIADVFQHHSAIVRPILDKININHQSQFVKEELESLISEKEIFSLMSFTSSKLGELKVSREIDKDNLLADKIIELLNELEYFAISFNSGIADHITVYQSLHQTFLDYVVLLYPYIAFVNEDPVDMLYTNIIALFKKWYTLRLKKEKQANISKKQSEVKFKKLEKKMQKQKDKSIVPPKKA